MESKFEYPVINLVGTGKNIKRLRKEKGIKVSQICKAMGFENPQAVYKWQSGKSLPTVDNLVALSRLLGTSMEDILVLVKPVEQHNSSKGLQDAGPSVCLFLPTGLLIIFREACYFIQEAS